MKMDKVVTIAMICLFTVTGFIGMMNMSSGHAGGAGLADSAWPCFGHDNRHTGRSPYDTGHVNGTETWSISIGSDVPSVIQDYSKFVNKSSSPAIGPEGTIYVGSDSGELYAFYPNGTKKWNYSTCGQIRTTPAVGEDGTIYIASTRIDKIDGYPSILYAINPNGTLKWQYEPENPLVTSANIGDDGTIYIGTKYLGPYAVVKGELLALNPNGTLKWESHGRTYSSPAVGTDGGIYFGSDNNRFKALSKNGTERWSLHTGTPIRSSPAIGPNGTVYFGTLDNNTYALNSEGDMKWSFSTEGSIIAGPAIASAGTVYIGSEDDKLYAIDDEGTLKWNFTTGGDILASPAIGGDGTIYVGSYDGVFYALRPNGSLKWSYSTGSSIASTPAIAADGTVYMTSNDGQLYKFGVDPTPVTVSISSPNEDALVSNSSVVVEWSGDENTPDVYRYETKLDSRDWMEVGDNTSHTFSSISEGYHTVTVNAFDAAGNMDSDKVNFTVDTIPPTLSIISPVEGVSSNASDMTVKWNGSNDVSYCEIRINDGSWIDKGTEETHLFSDLSEGEYTVELRAYDTAGNYNEAKVTFRLDWTAPSLTITSPSQGANISSSSVTVEWNGSDDITSIDHYEVKIDHGNWMDVGKETNHTFDNLSEGPHTIEVKAVDEVGNKMRKSVEINIIEEDDSGGGGDTPGFTFPLLLISIFLAIIYRRKRRPR